MLFSRSSLVLAFALVLSVAARPYEKRWFGWGGAIERTSHWWKSSPASSFGGAGKRWGLASSSCDLSTAVQNMNLAAASPALPGPDPSYTLFQVVVGRGTQNYTCDLSNSTAVPVPIGALASLFDISCVAVNAKELLPVLPVIALDLPVPTSDNIDSPTMQDLTGYHYFLDATTPFFNMDTANHQYGMGAMAKANASDAPTAAYAGPDGQGNGAVQWLKLNTANPAPESTWKQVYRTDTAGGAAPKMCTGQQATFEVPYAAIYWLFT